MKNFFLSAFTFKSDEAVFSFLVFFLRLFLNSRVASPKLVMEEAPESYKNVTDVVDTCHAVGISRKAIKLRPIGVIKGWAAHSLRRIENAAFIDHLQQ